MIISFGDQATSDIFHERETALSRRVPNTLRRATRRRLNALQLASEPRDLRTPPGNRFESLRGDWHGWFSIRVNDQFRIIFQWDSGRGGATEVRVIDYH